MRRYAICLLLLLSACANQPPAPVTAPMATPIPAGKAEVNIYRRAIPLGPAALSIYDGPRLLGPLPVGTYIQYYANPGPRALKVIGQGTSSIPYATTFVAGHRYYFSVYFLGDQQHGDASLSSVDATQAADQMAPLKAIPPSSGMCTDGNLSFTNR